MPPRRQQPEPSEIPSSAIHHAFWSRSPVGMARVGRDGTFLQVNPAFCAITGYSERELLVRTYQSITHPADLAADESEAEHLSGHPEGTGYSMAKRYVRKDERIVWCELHVSALCSETDAFAFFVVFAVPLPTGASYRAESKDGAVVVRPSARWIDLFRDNPRESLLVIACLFGFVKGESLVDFLLHLFKK